MLAVHTVFIQSEAHVKHALIIYEIIIIYFLIRSSSVESTLDFLAVCTITGAVCQQRL